MCHFWGSCPLKIFTTFSVTMIFTKLKPSTQVTKQPRNRGLSLILVLLIISSILTGTVIVSEIIIRYSQVVKGVEMSEKAYFASEIAMEKMLYQVLKNYANVTSVTVSGTLPENDATYSAGISVDTDNPGGGGAISNGNPWIFTLDGGESFQLNLDINGATYPTTLTIENTGGTVSNLIIYSCTAPASEIQRMCSDNYAQSFSLNFSDLSPLTIDGANKYHKIRIDNLDAANLGTYKFTPTGATLPIGIIVTNSIGIYKTYERRIESNFPKWQTFGVD